MSRLLLSTSWLLIFALPASSESPRQAQPAEVERLIKQLGSDRFAEREAASKALDATGRQLRCLMDRTSYFTAVAFSPDRKLMLSGNDEQTVRLWDVQTGKELWSFEGHTRVSDAVFSPNGKWVLLGGKNGSI
jgi:WD40 repeat protein